MTQPRHLTTGGLALCIALVARTSRRAARWCPGHGSICDESDVVDYRDMLTIIRDRVEDLVKDGKTLEQVRAARPSRDYDARYGATTGTWTTDKLIAVVYRGLASDSRPR